MGMVSRESQGETASSLRFLSEPSQRQSRYISALQLMVLPQFPRREMEMTSLFITRETPPEQQQKMVFCLMEEVGEDGLKSEIREIQKSGWLLFRLPTSQVNLT
jgi:hypothetical protein